MSALPRYRFLLGAIIFLLRVYGMFVLLIPALFVGDLMDEFHLSSAAVGNYTGFIMWACAAVVLFSGPMVTKIGSKNSVSIGIILEAVGMFLTAVTPVNYWVACGARFVLGLGMVILTVGVMPLTMTWFTTEEYGKINGLMESSAPLGILLNFAITPILFPRPLWRQAHLFYGIPGIILVALWFIFGRGPRVEIKREEEKYLHLLRERLPKLSRIKEIVLMGWLMAVAMGVEMAMGSWLPSYLELEWGWPIVTAAWLVNVNNIANICSWSFGGVLSDRIGLRRPFLIVGGPLVFLALIMAVTFVGPMTWFWYGMAGVCTAIYGFAAGAIPMEHPKMRPELISTAMSIVVFFGFIASAILPTLFGWVLDITGSLYIAMAVGASLYVCVAIIGLLCMETGWKAAAKKE